MKQLGLNRVAVMHVLSNLCQKIALEYPRFVSSGEDIMMLL